MVYLGSWGHLDYYVMACKKPARVSKNNLHDVRVGKDEKCYETPNIVKT